MGPPIPPLIHGRRVPIEHLLQVNELETVFTGDYGRRVVLDRISFYSDRGQTLAIVGESGCGKSVTSLSILGILDRNAAITHGSIVFDGQELTGMTERQLDRIRGGALTMIFQDALTALTPALSIGSQLTEAIRAHLPLSRGEARRRAVALLQKVGLPDAEAMLRRYPHALSGGQRQRVMIAMALACDPKLLIADEPTTALDVTIQAQIMQLLHRLQKENGMGLILITHDIGLVAQMADRVLVMYAGQIVEQAPVQTLFDTPRHPYTRALLASVPGIGEDAGRVLASIPGTVPENYHELTGCRFASRCPYAQAACHDAQPLRQAGPEHLVRCCRAMEVLP